MKILHVVDHTKRFNGMVHAAVDLACAQAEIGHEVAICSGGGDFDEMLTRCGVTIYTVPPFSKSPKAVNTVLGFFRAVRDFKPDIIHAHMVASTIISWPIAKLSRTSFITVVQNSFSKNATYMGLGDLVVCGCSAVADSMFARGIPRKKLRPVLNGTIGSPRLPAQAPPDVELQHPAVLTVCGLHPRKGIPDLLNAFDAAVKQLPDLHLYLVGEGPHEAEYKALVASRQIPHVHFIGAVLDPRPYLKAADLFVLASLADPAPLVLSEAREAGLAVIGTRVDGIPELLENGQAGILVSPNAPDELAAKITELFADPEKLAQWRRNSQINIQHLSLRRVAEQTVDVYLECQPRPAMANA